MRQFKARRIPGKNIKISDISGILLTSGHPTDTRPIRYLKLKYFAICIFQDSFYIAAHILLKHLSQYLSIPQSLVAKISFINAERNKCKRKNNVDATKTKLPSACWCWPRFPRLNVSSQQENVDLASYYLEANLIHKRTLNIFSLIKNINLILRIYETDVIFFFAGKFSSPVCKRVINNRK